jgi:hypothetical protein
MGQGPAPVRALLGALIPPRPIPGRPGRPRAFAFGILSAGEVSEWLKVPLSKSGVRKHRGFESHPLRHALATPTCRPPRRHARGEVA